MDSSIDAGEERSSSRRDLIRRTAKAAAVAWTVPLVIDGISNPAAAATCAKGKFYVAFESPAGGGLAETVSAASCTVTVGYVNTTAAAVALSAAFTGAIPAGATGGSIAHIASGAGNAQAVQFTISGCSCVITRVMGVVHLRTAGACPSPECQTAPSTSLLLTAGAIGTTTVTVAPNFNAPTVCTGAAGIHWGSPNITNGKLVVEIRCG